MSQGMTKRPPEYTDLPRGKQLPSHIVAHLDERFKHLSDTILPPQPYLLSVPSDVPYRHSSRFVNTWYEGTPFDRKEEQLQYLSFLPHSGEHESLLRVEGGWADDHGNPIVEEELSPKALPATGRHTPADAGNRKKISLKDYKTKARSPSQAATESQPPKKIETSANPPLSVEKEKHATQPLLEKKQEKQPIVPETNGAKDHPLKVSRMDGHNSPKIPPKMQQTDSPNPAKRRKLSPAVEDPKPGAKTSKVESQSSTMKMPRLLSPTLPSPEKENSLPQLLSPVLPPSLAKALSTPPNTTSIGSPASGLPKRSDPVRLILAGADLDNEPPGDRGGLAPGGSKVRSDSQHSARSSAPGTPNAAKVGLGAKILAKNGIRSGTPLHNGVRASPGPRQRHTIILKYGKKNRKRVEALLKFAPRPKKDLLKQDLLKQEAPDSQYNSDAHARKETSKKEPLESQPTAESKPRPPAVDDIKLEKKRKAEDSSPGPSLKKVKPGDHENRPVTPIPPAGKTAVSSQSKSTFSTPKKEFKSTLMRRVESSDGVDAPTPTGDKARVSTPQAAPKPSPQPPTSSTSSREEERQQWSSINSKFFTLGRTLKHEGSALLPAPDSDAKPSQSAKAVLKLIEALLCFMINMSAQSHARPSIDPGWRSIILYHIFVFRQSRKFPHLHGLVVQLGAVCRQLVHKYDMDRLARDPLPDDYCNSAPTPGSDGNTKTNEDGEKYKKRYVEFKDELIQNARELQTAWLDGSRQLSPDLLKREYPITWSKRAKDSSARLLEKLTPSRIPQDFYLPMDANTTAFEAARFGVSFLQEWAEKGKVDWKTRIDL
ncbi:uncharacterized protein Z520_10163 [Fonsecaea multimorphosa CBS 102226]|uniref:Uncharacterized protein n=1 Tax=Fonsecaea multimorphosa CBS 102226 TaxID=1442371 RepID=A0A0D2JLF5_9EURO|nr:uncharacterized protein Z520_10163 [Fonsecaea multimorphosa CBS 102226]KIX94137.1 hypothetical protein Z520_10163 [Fonsecaea multimorphosa CBS 102226]OAL19490.1 hypothetical protein AYO22_09652 [Fonsecaea multimorphosa]